VVEGERERENVSTSGWRWGGLCFASVANVDV